MWMRRSWCVVVMLVLIPSRARAGVSVRGVHPDFTAVLPDGFVAVPPVRERERERDDGVRAFVAARPGHEAMSVSFRVLADVISRQSATVSEVRAQVRVAMPGDEIATTMARVMDFDVPLAVVRTAGRSATAIATLPSMPRAVQLTVTGGRDDAGEVERVARVVMGSFRARSNWLTSAEVARKRAAYWIVVAAWGVALAYAVAWVARFRRAERPRGVQLAWLLACAVAFGAGAVLLATLPRGASVFDPVTPALAGAVVLLNAIAIARKRRTTSATHAARGSV
jgi:hypothetical protein